MAFLTDRKRAEGLGAAHSGTEQHWRTQITSIALLILVPVFVFTFGPMLGADYATVTTYYARPFPAIVAGLTIGVGFLHFKEGVRVLIEDYVHGPSRRFLIIAMICISNAAILVAFYALIRLAF